MIEITDITKNTYHLTFDTNANYNWHSITKLLISSNNLQSDFTSQKLLDKEETEEKLKYWQDLFFMELAELDTDIAVDANLLSEIKIHPLFIENKKFVKQLPKVTTSLGRDLLIDTLIDTKNADELIPDEILASVLKKKSREELREQFESWSEENPVKNTKRFKTFSILKYLMIASFVGVIFTVGYNSIFNSSYDFDNNSLVYTSEKIIIKDVGLGFAEQKKQTSISVNILNYDKAIVSGKANKLLPNTYSFEKNKLRLVLTASAGNFQLLEINKNNFFIKINNNFYKFHLTKEFENLQKLNDSLVIEKLEQILFENE
jgi:hypothetical protein